MRPQQQRILIEFTTGEVAIMSFLTRGRASALPPGAKWAGDDASFGVFERQATEENVIDELSRFALTDGRTIVGWKLIGESEIPADRTYRDAWAHDGSGKIFHDMPRARELHRAKLRRARVTLLESLDIEAIRADESGDKKAKAAVVARKQALRDAPADPAIEAAKTIEELKEVTLPEAPE